MDISPVLTGSKCQSCGGQTPQRNDCWYKDETFKSCGKRGHLAKVCRSGNAQAPMNGSPRCTGKGSGKGSSKGKRQGKDTWTMHVLWKRRTQESRLQIQDCNMFKPRKVWSLESGCVETRTHMKLRKVQMNPIQKSLSKKFVVWLFKTLSTMVTVSAPRTLTYFQNIVMRQNS